MNTKTIAKKIADQFFQNGQGKKAERLVLELKGKRNGGGWCKQAVIDVIVAQLEAAKRGGER